MKTKESKFPEALASLGLKKDSRTHLHLSGQDLPADLFGIRDEGLRYVRPIQKSSKLIKKCFKVS